MMLHCVCYHVDARRGRWLFHTLIELSFTCRYPFFIGERYRGSSNHMFISDRYLFYIDFHAAFLAWRYERLLIALMVP